MRFRPGHQNSAAALPLHRSRVPWSSTFNFLQELSFTSRLGRLSQEAKLSSPGFRRAFLTQRSHVSFPFKRGTRFSLSLDHVDVTVRL